MLLAEFVAARLAGCGPADAAELAAVEAGALLHRRLAGDDAKALVAELRRLHACALVLERLGVGGIGAGAGDELFAASSALVRAVNAHVPYPVVALEFVGGAADRAARLLSGCWALLSVGWPRGPGLSVAAVRGALDAEVSAVRLLCGR